MSKNRKRGIRVVFDPGFKLAIENSNAKLEPNRKGVAYNQLDFSREGHVDPDEADFKRRLAIMLSAAERKARPWCPECSVHKVGRNSKDKDAPYDSLCGICSIVAAKHGRRQILNWHAHYCGSCQKKANEKKEEVTRE